ncbi:MAG TPA: molybdopterin biosynthesis protein [Solirubrobacteraceae bacterium]|nr:molybdopterin biosynthesis protein [Solirubrobacteraceae bacterium]
MAESGRVSAAPAPAPFLRDVPLASALERWDEACAAAGCPQRLPAVTLALGDALGRVTAEPIWAARSSPPFDAAAMDGIAVRSERTVGASETTPLWLAQDEFVVVDTGDPIPEGFDAVVMREHVHLEGGRAQLRAAVPPHQHVRSIGEDVSATELLIPAGHRLRAVDVAAAAAAGAVSVSVRRAPVVAVLPTGDEIRPLGSKLAPGELPDTNSLMLSCQARELGCETLLLDIEPDDPERIAAAILGVLPRCDLLLVIAGSSAGRDDHTAALVDRLGRLSVHGVAVRPGHPVVLGAIQRTPVIGCPGYPVSAALTFDIFAAPLLARLEGTAPARRPVVRARLARKLASSIGVDDWVRVRLGRVGERLVASPLPRGAGVLTSLVRADGLLVVDARIEGHHAGEEVDVSLLRPLQDVERTIVAIGSHDPILDLAASALRQRDPELTLASTHVGSLGGLIALRDGLCHLAGSHLLDAASGLYTLPWVQRLMGDRDMAVVRLVHRQQGLLVAPGNPLGLRGIADLARAGVRYVNRQPGAGTRVLLDYELQRAGVHPSAISGYAREEPTHLAVAAAIASGRADCGLGVMAAARAFDLDFIPVADEPYDLVLEAQTLKTPLLAPLWELLGSEQFRRSVLALGGYDVSEMGRRIQ